jgi:F0F1-type ATP synthase delta subunit
MIKIISSHALNTENKKLLEKLLQNKFGVIKSVNYSVAKDLILGICIIYNSRIYHFDWRFEINNLLYFLTNQ